jgi:2-polyprenyl-6-hydroxyphenyl methylase/3-demethylubiquinone-9 3-methyltransferase
MDLRADLNSGPTKAPHTADYLWAHIVSLCAALHARRVVDIGCGNGALCRELADRGYEVVGCEPSAESLHFAQLGAPGLVFHRLGVDDDLSVIGNESFDVAIATEVIEHVVTPFNLPHFAKQLLRPGGYLIVSTPYHGYLKNLVLAFTNKWDSHLNPFWDGGHIKFWSYKTLSRLLNESGFRVVRFIGAGRLPFLWKSMIVVAQKVDASE